MMEHVPTARLARIPVPVTWLLGGRSIGWYADLHRRVAAVVPGLHTGTIDGAGHLVHVEQPEAFAKAALAGVARGA